MRNLRQARIDKGLSQKELASRAGVVQSIISDYERGAKTATVKTLRPIAAVLGVAVRDLLPESDLPSQIITYSPPEPKPPWRDEHPDRFLAQRLANEYPQFLNILFECPCLSESKHKHHPDYSRPFEVILCCPACHKNEHARLRRALRAEE